MQRKLDKFLQNLNIYTVSALEASNENKSSDIKEEHFSNILFIKVTLFVLNDDKLIVVKEEHL